MLILSLTACSGGDPSKLRQHYAKHGTGAIDIGLAWPNIAQWKVLANGAELAIEQINAKGGFQGRKLNLVKRDDQSNINDGLEIAQDFSNNSRMIAVIGHVASQISLSTSEIYDLSGLLMLTPASTSTRLTHQGLSKIFRLVPSDKQMGRYLASYAHRQGYKRVLIFYSRNEYGRSMANDFEKNAVERDMTIVDRRSFVEQTGRYDFFLRHWKRHFKFDAILLIASLPEGAHIVKAIRRVGMTQPILSADSMAANTLIDMAGENAEGMVVISFVDIDNLPKRYDAFRKAYVAKFKKPPTVNAGYGYNAVMLLFHAMQGANSAEPEKIAAYLKQMKPWSGVTGDYSFDDQGNLLTKGDLTLMQVKNGKFVTINGKH